jgi:hypothetical protein
VDQGQREADRDAGKTDRGALRGRADDDEQKEERHHHFHQEAAAEPVFAGAEIAVAVRGEAARDPAGMARRDDPQHRRRGDRRDHLGDDIGDDVTVSAAPRGPQTKRHRRVEMPARDMADGVGHRQHGQAKGEGNAEKSDPQAGKRGGEHRRTAAAKHQPERPEEFGGDPPSRVGAHRFPPLSLPPS